MASIKISELNEYTEVQDDDLFVVVDINNEETKKVKATNIGTGGKELIMVGDESVATSNTKLLIETNSLNNLGTEVVDTLDGNETDKAPSVRAVKEELNNLDFFSNVIAVTFSSYIGSISNTALGIEDCTKYLWQTIQTSWNDWCFIDDVAPNYIHFRKFTLSGVSNGTLTLVQSGTYNIKLRGIKIKNREVSE